MLTIWKYQVNKSADFEHKWPVGAQILDVQEQHGDVVMWVLLDKDEGVLEWRKFQVIMTGEDIYGSVEDHQHIATVQLSGGNYVLHIFEEAQ